MTLFNVVKKNVIGNFKSYLIYFISMILSVVIYYTFVALKYSSDIQKSISASDSMNIIFTEGSVILILFVAVFVLYSNAFFTKRRKKEVGLYSLLGVRKKTIGSMLFYENLIMGSIALLVGIVLGTILSKLFVLILLKLLDSAIEISFSLSWQAIINTAIVFAIVILFTSIQSYRVIYRFKLIELFQAEKEGEQAPKTSVIVAVLAIILIAFSYWLVFQPMETSARLAIYFLLFMVCIIIGTLLLFRSLTIYLLRMAQKNKARYYRGMNLIGTSQLLYRIKGNARMLATIALLSAVTLSAITVGYTQYVNVATQANKESPFSYTFVSQDEAFDQQVEKVIAGDQAHPVTAQLDIPVIRTKIASSNLEILPPSVLEEDENPLKLISRSTFNLMSKALDRETQIELTGEQAAIIRPLYTSFSSADFRGFTLNIKLPQGEQAISFVTLLKDRVLSWSYPDFLVIVSDGLYAEMAKQVPPITYKVYKVANEESASTVSAQLKDLDREGAKVTAYYSIYRHNLEDAGLGIFMLGFLGLVFLAATGSMIYFKQLTEAHSDKRRYEILRKIGVSKKEIRNSVAKQTLFVFGLPLAVGIVHSTMILKALLSINLITFNYAFPIVLSVTAYIIIYLFYYVITVNSFNKIVNS
ncbi:FtsX-like permease family protein [Paenibacillus psychroresistens]|uniref:FtsX-like permease family protein n=1 Tax=Paenibacillus psychroresistens TaxID=1778678 RepID=A0A6B8RST5_9BACL|nr:ABC transporter permease [Paenibacillus psychroresistens]QGQ98874.1 FtsX-like permease family protein [Paenibacillus psychroresistens]